MNYFKKVVTDGFVVLATLAILFFVFRWLFNVVKDIIEYPTGLLLRYLAIPEPAAMAVVLAILFLVCFFIGNFIRTWAGEFIHKKTEKILPLYKTVKEILSHVFGEGKLLSCKVVIAEILPGTKMTGLITAEHETMYTIFVPTAPNPTTGFIFHVPKERVHILSGVTKEEMFRTIVACGMGSEELLKRLTSQNAF